MSPTSTYPSDDGPSASSYDPNAPTIAAFSPQTFSGATTRKQRSTIIVHKKSPLLVATPPQVTRALAYSHPFLLPLNKFVGLLSWNIEDPWESFLLVAGFWGITLYGRELLLWTGPIIVVIGLILAMYSRRYSPLSSTTRTGEQHGHRRAQSDVSTTHHKSLDEIVETLRIFTTRCNLLLEPFLSLTDFLSTQRTPTSATTRPALTTLFIRVLLVTPLWIILTLPPFYIITTRRVILTFGTVALTWHSRPARVSRVILWRSLTVRRISSLITGLSFSPATDSSASSTGGKLAPPPLPPRRKSESQENTPSDLAMKHRAASPGVRFTFILYENQRRWIGLGWTSAMLAYERASWTDEHVNPAPSKEKFELPKVESNTARWRWVEGSAWKLEGGSTGTNSPAKQSGKGTKPDATNPTTTDGGGWIYYDNKWNDGKRDADSWGKYTRRRKWYRDAELVEVTPSTELTPSTTPNEAAALSEAENDDGKNNSSNKSPSPNNESSHRKTPSVASSSLQPDNNNNNNTDSTNPDSNSKPGSNKRKSWFGSGREKERRDSKSSDSMGKKSLDSVFSARTDPDDDHVDQWKSREGEGGRTFGLGEDAVMGLG